LLESRAKKIKKIAEAWNCSLFGIIEKRLVSLVKTFTVYGFNAESFDLILLAGRLCTYAKEKGCRNIKMTRNGGKITSLIIDGLRIGEIKRLLSPGTSLAGLAKTVGIPESKASFPFQMFTSEAYLREKRLPEKSEQWQSDLSPGKKITQEEVDEIQKLYDLLGFKNVGDYLVHYLKLDCVILQKCIAAMHEKFYQCIELDFVECSKFTVSSLSSLAVQTFLSRNKRPGFFFPNHARMYAVSIY
jgi:hypothetical protein